MVPGTRYAGSGSGSGTGTGTYTGSGTEHAIRSITCDDHDA